MLARIADQVTEAFSLMASRGMAKVEAPGKKVVVGTLLSLDADAWIVDEAQRMLGVFRTFDKDSSESVGDFLTHVSQCAYRARLHAGSLRTRAWDWHAFILSEESGSDHVRDGWASSLSAPIGVSILIVPTDQTECADLSSAISRYCDFIRTGKIDLKGHHDWRVLSFFAALFPVSRTLLRRESTEESIRDIRGAVRKRLLQRVLDKSRTAIGRWVQIDDITAMVNTLLDEVAPTIDGQVGSKLVRLNSIQVKQLRALDSVHGRFGNLTFIVGGNGSGKSSLVEAIRLAVSGASSKTDSEILPNLNRGGSPEIAIEAQVHNGLLQTTVQLGYPSSERPLVEDIEVLLLDQKRANIVGQDPESRATQLLGLLGGYGEDVLDAIDKRIAELAARLRSCGLVVNVNSRGFVSRLLDFLEGKIPKPDLAYADLPPSLQDYPDVIKDIAMTWKEFRCNNNVEPASINLLVHRAESALTALDGYRSDLQSSWSILRRALASVTEFLESPSLGHVPDTSDGDSEHLLGDRLPVYLAFPSRGDIEKAALAAETIARKTERFLSELRPALDDASHESPEFRLAWQLGNELYHASERFIAVLRSSDLAHLCDDISTAINRDSAARKRLGMRPQPHGSPLERLSSEIALAREVLGIRSSSPKPDILADAEAASLLRNAISTVGQKLETLGKLPDLKSSIDALKEMREFFDSGKASGLLRVAIQADVLAAAREELVLEQSETLTRVIETDVGTCFIEIAAALSASRWAQPDALIRYEPPNKRKEVGKILLTTPRKYANDTVSLGHVINFGEQALVNLAWFFVRYAVVGRHVSNVLIIDDPFACLDPAHQEYAVRTLIRLATTVNPDAQVVLALNPQDEVVEMLREMGNGLRAQPLLGEETGEVCVFRTAKVSQYHCKAVYGSMGRRDDRPWHDVVADLHDRKQPGDSHSGVRT